MEQVNIWRLRPGTKVTVRTRNHEYHLEMLDQRERIRITGGNYFPKPEVVFYQGATRGGVMRVGRIVLEHSMDLICENGRIVSTSGVEAIEIDGPGI